MKTRRHNRINGIHVKCNYASQDFESRETISKINNRKESWASGKRTLTSRGRSETKRENEKTCECISNHHLWSFRTKTYLSRISTRVSFLQWDNFFFSFFLFFCSFSFFWRVMEEDSRERERERTWVQVKKWILNSIKLT